MACAVPEPEVEDAPERMPIIEKEAKPLNVC